MMSKGNRLLRVCAVLNVVFLGLAIMTDAHSFITPNLMNTCRLLEVTIRHLLFLQNIFVQKLILRFLHLYDILDRNMQLTVNSVLLYNKHRCVVVILLNKN
jgi:hypothetical protein